jgi:hypothetical protein
VGYKSIEYGVLSIGRYNVSGGGSDTRLKGRPETGELAGGIHFRVPGDGHGRREFRSRQFGHRELAPGFRRLKAEQLTPERLKPVAVTRHLE